MSPEYPTLAAVLITALAGVTLGVLQLTRRARQTRLDALEFLSPQYRERVLSKFTPKIQVEIRLELQKRARRTGVPAKSVMLAKWFSFLAATKGARFHEMLDFVLIVFLVLGMFGGAFTGFFLSEHFASHIPFIWECGFLIIGMYGAIFGFFVLRFLVLRLTFHRYRARIESKGKR